MNSGGDKIYIKIVALNAIYNFIVMEFLFEDFESKKFILISQILKFKIFRQTRILSLSIPKLKFSTQSTTL
jgi:hypothetical protein